MHSLFSHEMALAIFPTLLTLYRLRDQGVDRINTHSLINNESIISFSSISLCIPDHIHVNVSGKRKKPAAFPPAARSSYVATNRQCRAGNSLLQHGINSTQPAPENMQCSAEHSLKRSLTGQKALKEQTSHHTLYTRKPVQAHSCQVPDHICQSDYIDIRVHKSREKILSGSTLIIESVNNLLCPLYMDAIML